MEAAGGLEALQAAAAKAALAPAAGTGAGAGSGAAAGTGGVGGARGAAGLPGAAALVRPSPDGLTVDARFAVCEDGANVDLSWLTHPTTYPFCLRASLTAGPAKKGGKGGVAQTLAVLRAQLATLPRAQVKHTHIHLSCTYMSAPWRCRARSRRIRTCTHTSFMHLYVLGAFSHPPVKLPLVSTNLPLPWASPSGPLPHPHLTPLNLHHHASSWAFPS